MATRGLPSSSVKGGQRVDARRRACLTGGSGGGVETGAALAVASAGVGCGGGATADVGAGPQPPTQSRLKSRSRGSNRRENTSGRYQSGPIVTSVSDRRALRF